MRPCQWIAALQHSQKTTAEQATPVNVSRARPAARRGSGRRCCAGRQARCVPAPPLAARERQRAKAGNVRRMRQRHRIECGKPTLQMQRQCTLPRRQSRCRRHASHRLRNAGAVRLRDDFGVEGDDVIATARRTRQGRSRPSAHRWRRGCGRHPHLLPRASPARPAWTPPATAGPAPARCPGRWRWRGARR